ncbi:MAG: phosphate ABC transporter permease PstA [Clostridiales bacterium]|nr:phosphate ABC transporter permease PstA [Clostridiales bacterium]HBM81339.1 phosphate ABC transporter permease PtsA [Clostridiaceae bacterium]
MNAKIYDKIATSIFYLIASLIMLLLFLIVGYILYKGIGVLNLKFITTPPKFMEPGGGVAPQLFNSFYLLVLSMLITIPLGVGAGIYMAEYARPGRITDFIRLCIETLSSLPSIVVGLFGFLVFVNSLHWGFSLLSGALAITVLNLPAMTRISEDAIKSVPESLKEASLALGATKWETIYKVILPSAMLQLITGTILTAGRVFGEAAALLYTSGMTTPDLKFNRLFSFSKVSPLNPLRPAETLSVFIWKINSESLVPDARQVADGASALLIIIVFLFNIISRYIGKMIYRKHTGSK